MLCPSVSAGTASCTQTSIRSLLARAEPGTLQRLARGRGTVRCYEAGNACRGFVARGLGWSLGSGWFKGSCLGGGGGFDPSDVQGKGFCTPGRWLVMRSWLSSCSSCGDRSLSPPPMPQGPGGGGGGLGPLASCERVLGGNRNGWINKRLKPSAR